MRRFLYPLILCVMIFCDAHVVFADAFTLSGIINRRLRPDEQVFVDGSARSIESFALNGTMDISSNPTIIDVGDRYKILYHIAFNFMFAEDSNISGTGAMLVDGNGCGLFDCNMAGVAAADNIGHRYSWTVDTGTFFHADGTPYPSVFDGALPYAVTPARFELNGWDFYYTSGPIETYNSYYIPTLTATRVPEPTLLLLMGIGAAAFMLARRH